MLISGTRSRVVLVAMAIALALPAYPWGAEGHRALALLAQKKLTPNARAHVVAILGSDDLASIAVWMDEVRSAAFHAGPLGSDPEALKFNAVFPKNGEWHYVDLPLGLPTYDPDGAFSRPDDVVHMVRASIDVLEGRGDVRITRRQALCMIVHFVGDLHQPMHVGNGFFRLAQDGTAWLVTDPAAAGSLPNDKGGNADFFGPGRYDELHAYWDSSLVDKIDATRKPAKLALLLEDKAASEGAAWASRGDYHAWAQEWAAESLCAARTAYAGIIFGTATPDTKGGLRRIQITLPPGYDATCVPLAEERLAKAGYHLAEILNAIQWSD